MDTAKLVLTHSYYYLSHNCQYLVIFSGTHNYIETYYESMTKRLRSVQNYDFKIVKILYPTLKIPNDARISLSKQQIKTKIFFNSEILHEL